MDFLTGCMNLLLDIGRGYNIRFLFMIKILIHDNGPIGYINHPDTLVIDSLITIIKTRLL